MFGKGAVSNNSMMSSKINSTTLKCFRDIELENQKLRYQLTSLQTAHAKLRDRYQSLYSQTSNYYQEAEENKEYKEQYATLHKKYLENQETMRKTEDIKQQPILQQGNEYRRQFPYISHPNEVQQTGDGYIKSKSSKRDTSREPPKKKRRERDNKKTIAHKYKKYCDLYKEQNTEEQEVSDGEHSMENGDGGDNRDSR